MSKNNIKKNILLNTIYQILTVITPFITTPYLARILGPDNIGINSYTHSILAYFSMFAVLGTKIYGSREISRTRDNKELYSKYFWEIELLSVFTSICMIFLWFIFIFFAQQYKIFYLILTLNLLSSLFDISWLYTGLEQFKYTVTRNCLVRILGIILILTLVKEENDLWILILINSTFTLLGNISMWIPLRKFIIKIPFKSLNIWLHFNKTLIFFIPTIASSIYQVLDKTLIGIITNDSRQNGFYEEANKILTLVKTLCYSAVTTVLGTRNSYLYEQKEYNEVKKNINTTIDIILFLSIGACFGIIGVAKNFLTFFLGKSFFPSILLLQLMSPCLIIIGFSITMNHLYFIPSGLNKKSCFFEIIGAILNLILNLILIPQLKSVGAVIGTIVSETLIATLYICLSNGFLTFKTIFILSWKKFISAILMLIYLMLIAKINLPGIVIFIIQFVFGAAIYMTSLLVLKDDILFKVIKKGFKHGK